MSTVRVTKEFHWEMSHALNNYNGLCRNIHGHSYIFRVCIKGPVLQDEENAKNGMVIDFGIIKNIVNEKIVDVFDHALVLNENSELSDYLKKNASFERLILKPYQPTCENMVVEFAGIIKKELPKPLSLHSLRLYETQTSFAEWFESDN